MPASSGDVLFLQPVAETTTFNCVRENMLWSREKLQIPCGRVQDVDKLPRGRTRKTRFSRWGCHILENKICDGQNGTTHLSRSSGWGTSCEVTRNGRVSVDQSLLLSLTELTRKTNKVGKLFAENSPRCVKCGYTYSTNGCESRENALRGIPLGYFKVYMYVF